MRSRTRTAIGLIAALSAGVALTAQSARAGQQAEASAARPGAAEGSDVLSPAVQDVVGEYCVTCHSERLKTGGLVLEGIERADIGRHADVWEKVLKKLSIGAMPPVGSRRPDGAVYKTTIAGIEDALDRAAAAGDSYVGRAPIHRLNRLQYTNAIRDLFGLEIDGRSMLPADDSGFGFDNIADLLKMSPTLLDRYLVASNKISRLVVGDPTLKPAQVTYSLPRSLGQEQRMSEDLPFGSRGGVSISHFFPLDGEYIIRITPNRGAAGVKDVIDLRLDRRRIEQFTVGGERRRRPAEDPDAANYTTPRSGTEARIPIKAGTHAVGVSFQDDVWVMEGVGVSRLPLGSGYGNRRTSAVTGKAVKGLGKLDIIGPYSGTTGTESAMYDRVFICTPARADEEEPCARTILQTLARRAYRRPATAQEIGTLADFYSRGRADGTFQTGIQSAVARMLMDVNFLFRFEQDPTDATPGAIYPVNDFELAQRLSFFLWSSIPDDTLLDLAEGGRLRNPRVIEQQVDRMLDDPRAATLVSTFFGQWLTLQGLAGARPDPHIFPEFDENLRRAFQEETRLFLSAQLREDRPVIELLAADYTFVNERLARFYGISDVSGSHFRRVSLGESPRRGILGQGSVLTVTSYPDRTSVVLRGKWVLDNLLGVPPPPPPPEVPPFEATEVTGTLRQRMETHRQNPVCASCHKLIDPIGFASENFDGIGKFRERDAGGPIDPSGVFLDGSTFDGPVKFRQVLLQYEDAFLATVVEKMMTYALGRGVDVSEMPALRRIIRDSADDDHRWSSVILGIVSSQPFQMRRVAS